MKFAVINEVSCAARNRDILDALEGYGHEVLNIGMKGLNNEPVLTFIETGLLSALALNLQIADFVIGGCGTGQGYVNSALLYPGVAFGPILTTLDAWMFIQINAGYCISLALNEGYGWESDQNLKMLFAQLFGDMTLWEKGYPPHRAESEKQTRKQLKVISSLSHISFSQIIDRLYETEKDMLKNVLFFPGVIDLIRSCNPDDKELKNKLLEKYDQFLKE